MLLAIAGILILLWLMGVVLKVGGGLIHTLLVIAVVVAIFHMITGRRSAV